MTDRSDRPVDELFGLLGNEVRMGIMQALWERFDFQAYVTRTLEPVAFSTLQAATDTPDSGNFNYHLGRLEGDLVENTGEGYRLSQRGYNLMRTIEDYATFESRHIEPTELSERCPFCEGPLEASYDRELFAVRCRDCGGLGSGNIGVVNVPATSVHSADPAALLDPAAARIERRVAAATRGWCWNCHHPLEVSVDQCADHRPGADGICPSCEVRFSATMVVECPSCGTEGAGPLLESALVEPRVRAAFETIGEGPIGAGSWQYRLSALGGATERLLDAEPITVEFQFELPDRTLELRVSEADPLAMSIE